MVTMQELKAEKERLDPDFNFDPEIGGGDDSSIPLVPWEQWRQSAADLSRQRRLISGAVGRLRSRALSRAWEKWQQTATEQKQQSCGFRKWREEAAMMSEQKRLVSGALQRLRNRALSRA